MLAVQADREQRRLRAANEARCSVAKNLGETVRERHPPLWFDLLYAQATAGDGLHYRWNGKYWKSRESGVFCSPDIFGLEGNGIKRFIPEE